MTLYIVRNERLEEVSAYTDPRRAQDMAQELQAATLRTHSVEQLVWSGERVEERPED